MLERLCISSFLGEIKCVREIKFCNPTFIVETFSGLGFVGFTSQIEKVFPR